MSGSNTLAAIPGTGCRTIADLLPLAGEIHGDRIAAQIKVDGEWTAVTYEELAARARRCAGGLVDLGIAPGDRVAILAQTRLEWALCWMAVAQAGAVVAAIYPSNSPEECEYILAHSGAVAAIVEDPEQLAKIDEVKPALPGLRHVVVMEDAPRGRLSLGALIDAGEARCHDVDARSEAVGPGDLCSLIYTSGTTGPPKACELTHGNWRATTSMTIACDFVTGDDHALLFLPLAHALGALIQLVAIDLGAMVSYWERDVSKIVANLAEVQPTFFPSVPRVFEKLHALVTAHTPDRARLDRAVAVGLEVRTMRADGLPVPGDLASEFDELDREVLANVRGLFGSNLRFCFTGAAPIAPEILDFLFACGIPVMEGYGLSETTAAVSVNRLDRFRFGSIGPLLPEVTARIADDGELLVAGPNIFRGYYKDQASTESTLVDGWLHTGDLVELDADGFYWITGRKKDIIITAGGKNVAPANLEGALRQNRWISQVVVVGDRRPYLVALVTLDPDVVGLFAEANGVGLEDVRCSPQMRAAVQEAVDALNATLASPEQIKRFAILEGELTQEAGDLTPTMKVKRAAVAERHAELIESLYTRTEDNAVVPAGVDLPGLSDGEILRDLTYPARVPFPDASGSE